MLPVAAYLIFNHHAGAAPVTNRNKKTVAKLSFFKTFLQELPEFWNKMAVVGVKQAVVNTGYNLSKKLGITLNLSSKLFLQKFYANCGNISASLSKNVLLYINKKG